MLPLSGHMSGTRRGRPRRRARARRGPGAGRSRAARSRGARPDRPAPAGAPGGRLHGRRGRRGGRAPERRAPRPSSPSRRWSTSSAGAASAARRRSPGRCCGCVPSCRSSTARSRPCTRVRGAHRVLPAIEEFLDRQLRPRPAAARRLRALPPAGGDPDLRALVARAPPAARSDGDVGGGRPDRRHARRARARSSWRSSTIRPAGRAATAVLLASPIGGAGAPDRRRAGAARRGGGQAARPPGAARGRRRPRRAGPPARPPPPGPWSPPRRPWACWSWCPPRRWAAGVGVAVLGLVFAASLGLHAGLRGAAARRAAASAAPASGPWAWLIARALALAARGAVVASRRGRPRRPGRRCSWARPWRCWRSRSSC